jgi:hypothetical protein
MGEINRLTRDDVDAVMLCTRKNGIPAYLSLQEDRRNQNGAVYRPKNLHKDTLRPPLPDVFHLAEESFHPGLFEKTLDETNRFSTRAGPDRYL